MYDSPKKRNRFLVVRRGAGISGVPATERAEFASARLFKQLSLLPSDRLVALNAAKAIESIDRSGYYITETRSEFKKIG